MGKGLDDVLVGLPLFAYVTDRLLGAGLALTLAAPRRCLNGFRGVIWLPGPANPIL